MCINTVDVHITAHIDYQEPTRIHTIWSFSLTLMIDLKCSHVIVILKQFALDSLMNKVYFGVWSMQIGPADFIR